MSIKLLSNITVVDFTQRLPGPFSTYLLENMGAKVIKIEHTHHQDAFLRGSLAKMDECFPSWYHEINKNKEIKRFDFDKEDDVSQILEIIKSADIIISSLPEKIKKNLSLTTSTLSITGKAKVFLELKASRNSTHALHDLNALCETGILKLFIADKSDNIVAPPFLPIAGTAFGHKVATEALAALLKAKEDATLINHNVYLYESTKELYDVLWPKSLREKGRTKFLHNGAYPCYSLYKTKDSKYVALAAIEEKYWLSFANCFELNVEAKDRFCKDEKIFNKLSELFKSFDQSEIIQKMGSHQFCLSAV